MFMLVFLESWGSDWSLNWSLTDVATALPLALQCMVLSPVFMGVPVFVVYMHFS